jgi:hypothetical protein
MASLDTAYFCRNLVNFRLCAPLVKIRKLDVSCRCVFRMVIDQTVWSLTRSCGPGPDRLVVDQTVWSLSTRVVDQSHMT